MTDFRFEPIEHRYYLNGREVIGLTSMLSAAGYNKFDKIPPHVLEFARVRGTAVHLATALHDRRTLNEASVHPTIAPYLKAWRAFLSLKRVQIIDIEVPIYSERWGFACTPDRTIYANGQLGVLEIKTPSALSEWYRLQTEGQRIAAAEFYKMNFASRFVVRLSDDGSYKLEQYRDYADRARFLSCLTKVKMRE